MRIYGLVAVVVLAVVVGYVAFRSGGSSTPTAATQSSTAPASSSPSVTLVGRPPNPAAGRLLLKSERAAAKQQWVDATVTTTSLADSNEQEITEQLAIGPHEAEDVETAAGQPWQQVFLVGKVVYVKAGQSALTLRDGISPNLAKAAQNRWISLQPGDAPYSKVRRIFSLGDVASAIGGVPFYGPYSGIDKSLVSTTSSGETDADVIYGWWDTGHSAFASLSVAQAAPHVPLDYSGDWGGTGTGLSITAIYSYSPQFQDPPPNHAKSWAALRRSAS